MPLVDNKNSKEDNDKIVKEIISYEILWAEKGNTPNKIVNLFSNNSLPSEIIDSNLPLLSSSDDIITSGSHIRAVYDFMHYHGYRGALTGLFLGRHKQR